MRVICFVNLRTLHEYLRFKRTIATGKLHSAVDLWKARSYLYNNKYPWSIFLELKSLTKTYFIRAWLRCYDIRRNVPISRKTVYAPPATTIYANFKKTFFIEPGDYRDGQRSVVINGETVNVFQAFKSVVPICRRFARVFSKNLIAFLNHDAPFAGIFETFPTKKAVRDLRAP